MDKLYKELKEKLVSIIIESKLAKKWVESKNKDLLEKNRDALAEEMSTIRVEATAIEEKKAPQKRTITQDDIDTNEGLGKDVKVGDEVTLPPAELSNEDAEKLAELKIKNDDLNEQIQNIDMVKEQINKLDARIEESLFEYKAFSEIESEINELIK